MSDLATKSKTYKIHTVFQTKKTTAATTTKTSQTSNMNTTFQRPFCGYNVDFKGPLVTVGQRHPGESEADF